MTERTRVVRPSARNAGLPHVAARILNTPLAITPEKLQAILAALGPRLGLAELPSPASAVEGVVREDRAREYAVLDGVAVVPIMGTIVKRNAGGVVESSGLVSTEAVKEVLLTALADPSVRALLLQIDSAGGEVAGTADLAAFLLAARQEKPIWAIADEMAYSAAYWIGSAAERLVLPQNGGVGSIGVIAVHVDESEANAQAGLAVTTIIAGAQKADFSPFAPLSERARATLQAEVDRVYGLFIDAVARGRGLAPAQVRSFEAASFQGTDAVRAGLADAIATFDDTFLELATRPMGAQRRISMAGAEKPPAAADGGGAERGHVIPLAEHQQATDAARLEGAKTERARCTHIRELAAMVRMPRAEAEKLAEQLIGSGASTAEAHTAFTTAQAKAQESAAAGVEILGHVPSAAELAARMPTREPKSREAVFAARRQTMLAARHHVPAATGGAA